jgi:HEAT repeat protein
MSLGQLHVEPNIAVPALINGFPGNDSLFRSLILFSLSEFKNDARQAIPMIVEALKDRSVSNSAAFALKQIDPAAAAKAGIK